MQERPRPGRRRKRRCSWALGNLCLLVLAAPRLYFISRNYMPSRVKSEFDLIGYDGERLAIIGSA